MLDSPAPPQGGSDKEIWLEIGFGGGEHLATQAARHPDVGFIGCEPYADGVAALLLSCASRLCGESQDLMQSVRDPAKPLRGPQDLNIRIFPDDARLLIEKLPDACLGGVFILFPDPWPKSRHHKRRLIRQPFLERLARVMKPGAELRLATDHPDYLTWMLSHLLATPHFEWTARRASDWLTPPRDWVRTRYQEWAEGEGRKTTYLEFKRR